MRFIISLLLILVTAFPAFADDLMVLSGAGLIKPMEELKTNFEKAEGVTVRVHYGSSGELFGMLSMGQDGDVLIPGAAKYTQDALNNGWIVEDSITNLVLHRPAIAVLQGNPKGITGLDDLTNPGVKVALGDPKGPAIGRVATAILKKNDLTDSIQPNVATFAPTVNQLLIYVVMDQVDAAIIWEDLASWSESEGKLELIQIAPERNMIKTIPTAVTTKGAENPLATKFNTYISSPEGLEIWKKWGFTPCEK